MLVIVLMIGALVMMIRVAELTGILAVIGMRYTLQVVWRERRHAPDEGHEVPRLLGCMFALPCRHSRPPDAVLNH